MAMNNEKMATGKFSMKPGSKNVSSPTTFRMDSPLKQLGMQPQTMGTGMGASPLGKVEKCHSSDAACMKRNREARKKSSAADHAKRAAAYTKTGDTRAFYKDRKPTVMAKGVKYKSKE